MPEAVHQLWFELVPPLRRWYWWLVEHRLTFPTRGMWLRRVENGVRELADDMGMVLIGDPIGGAEKREGLVVVRASALAVGPDGEGG